MFKTILVLVLFIFLSVSTAFAYTYDSHFDPLIMSDWAQELVKYTDTHAIIKIYDENELTDILVLLHRGGRYKGLKGYSYTYRGEHHLYIYNEELDKYELAEGSLEDWYK